MRKIVIILLLFPALISRSQSGTTLHKQGKKQLIRDSTVLQKLEQLKDSTVPVSTIPGNAEITESVSRNMEGILALQREREARQKKTAMIRISIGVGLLALLVVGLLRRKKK